MPGLRQLATVWLAFLAFATLGPYLLSDGGQPAAASPRVAAEGVHDHALGWLLRARWWRQPPERPEPPTIASVEHDRLQVLWLAPPSLLEIVDYDIQYRRGATGPFLDWNHEDTSTAATITGLVESSAYQVRVRAVHELAAGDWSRTTTGETSEASPRFAEGSNAERTIPENAPPGYELGPPVAASAGQRLLTYALEGTDASAFTVDTATGQLRTRANVSFDHEVRDRYELTVTAVDSRGRAAGIDLVVFVTDVDEPPAAPAAPEQVSASWTTLTIGWTEPENTGPPIDNYDVQFGRFGRPFMDAEHSGTSTTARLSSFQRATRYQFRVRASNAEGVGPWSEPGSGRTLGRSASDGQDGGRTPNIVLILADDLGIGDVGVYGGRVISTPNIDALATSGVRATEGYVSAPVCSPSRAGMLTGRNQVRHGWEFNPAWRDVRHGMSPAERTLADALRNLGYATGIVGKWHLGHRPQHHPLNRGFDEYFGILAGSTIYISSYTPGTQTVGPLFSRRPSRGAVYRGFEQVAVEQYLTDAFTDEAVAFMERHRDEPFFLYLSYTTPHDPLQATERYLQPYLRIRDPATRVYAAMVGSLDESIARVVAKLRQIGQYEDTLIAFLSDNGCTAFIGDNACSNAPHAGFKGYHHDGGIRVPFILSWPAGLPDGQVYEEAVVSLDLLATFTAAAGSPMTTEDSVNLLPYFRGEDTGRPHEHLYWRSGPNMAIRDARWKLIRYRRTNHTALDLDHYGNLPAPVGGWSTEAPLGYVTLLYDLDRDPGERINMARERPDVVERLLTRHAAWVDTLPSDPAILPSVRSTIAEFDGDTVQLVF